jgi:FMN-dependent NADH-azoreductase
MRNGVNGNAAPNAAAAQVSTDIGNITSIATASSASTRGGLYGPGSPAAALEHQESHLKAMLGFIGLTDITVVHADGLAIPDLKPTSIATAEAEIATLA